MGFMRPPGQAFAVLLPARTVARHGRRALLRLRCVETSSGGMTAYYYPYDHGFLSRAANRIINEVRSINRVIYDITRKPSGDDGVGAINRRPLTWVFEFEVR
jgi:GMP synthase (glutamine-hydrolysing)